MADIFVCRQHGLSEPCDLCGINRIDAEQCKCEHLFADHQKPPIGTPWDICSFPCVKCNCQEFVAVAGPRDMESPTEEEAEAVLKACGTSGKEVVNEFIERLLKENLELKRKLDARAAVAGPRGEVDLISRKVAVDIADARLKDIPDHVDLEADRSLFAAGYVAAAGSIKAALQRAPMEDVKSPKVQCADCLKWIDRDTNHTCRQQTRRNQRSAR